MSPDIQKTILNFLKQITKSKTITINTIILAAVVAYFKFSGVTLEPNEINSVIEVIALIITGVNIALRFVTKKPLKEKTKLME